MPPGGAIVVANVKGDIEAYAPLRGSAPDLYTVSAYGPAGSASISAAGLSVRATAIAPGVRFLVRGPRGTTMNLSTQTGDIGVADYDGVVNAHTGRGDIKMLIPEYGNASVGNGALSVIFSSTTWPGTLHFDVGRGTAEIYVNEHARARIRMHTDDGTVFSDFPITGTHRGKSETIDAPINGGGPRSIDIEVRRGDIRVIQLKPQI